MFADRFTFAQKSGFLESGLFTERVAVYSPKAGDDLSFFIKENVNIISDFYLDASWFHAQGYFVVGYNDFLQNPHSKDVFKRPKPKPYDCAVVCLERSKEASRAKIYQALTEVEQGGMVFVDGQKTDGIDSLWKECRALGLGCEVAISKAHGKGFLLKVSKNAKESLAHWKAQSRIVDGGFQTFSGVFSADGPDSGSCLLARLLPQDIGSYVIDLGAGWGFLSRHILEHRGVKQIDLVEADLNALNCAKHNISDSRASFFWGDACTFQPSRKADAVVMNAPFHQGRNADPSLGVAFILSAARILASNATLWVVFNRHLPYNRILNDIFQEVSDVGSSSSFRVVRASFPRAANVKNKLSG